MQDDVKDLRIVHYPDPRLRQACAPVTEFDDKLEALVQRMLKLMKAGEGVGLAGPQVGLNLSLFVMNATGEPSGERAFINPAIHEPHGSAEAEEGCLSLPGVNVQVRRAQRCRVTAQDPQGKPIDIEVQDLVARICQHETDHLHGVLITDRMGPSDRIANRKTMKALEDQYQSSAGAKAKASR